MTPLLELLLVVLRALLPVLVRNSPDTSEDGEAPGALEDRLRRKIRADGWEV